MVDSESFKKLPHISHIYLNLDLNDLDSYELSPNGRQKPFNELETQYSRDTIGWIQLTPHFSVARNIQKLGPILRISIH